MTRCLHAALAAALCLCLPAGADEIPPGAVAPDADLEIKTPLTDAEADAFRGLEVFVDRKRGNCVACHSNFDVAAMQFLGEIGPNLDWVGDRLSPAQLRAIVVDPKTVYGAQTIMPAFYSDRGGARVLEKFRGKPILTAQEVEDVVAYLSELSRGY
jgi:sulfur-oxidizing protein SoxX